MNGPFLAQPPTVTCPTHRPTQVRERSEGAPIEVNPTDHPDTKPKRGRIRVGRPPRHQVQANTLWAYERMGGTDSGGGGEGGEVTGNGCWGC